MLLSRVLSALLKTKSVAATGAAVLGAWPKNPLSEKTRNCKQS